MDGTVTEFFEKVKSSLKSEYAVEIVKNIEKSANSGSAWDGLSESLKENAVKLLRLPEWTCSVAALLVAILVFGLFKSSVKSRQILAALEFMERTLLTASLIIPIHGIVSKVCLHMQEVSALLGVLAPTVSTLAAVGGNISTAKTLDLFLSVLLSFLQVVLNKIIPIVCSFFFGTAIIDAVNKDGKMLALSGTVKNLLYVSLSIFTSLFLMLLSTQSLAATGTDSFSAKAVRLIIGNAVPIVGSTLGDALKLVGGSFVAVKNTVGVSASILLILVYLPPLATLFINGVIINFFIFVCDYFSLQSIKSVFIYSKQLISFLLAVFTCIFVMGMINIGIFIKVLPVGV